MGRYLQLLNVFEKNDIPALVENCQSMELELQAVMVASIRAHTWTKIVVHTGL